MPTVEATLATATARLRAAGSPSPRLDAELLLGHVLELERTSVLAHPDAPIGDVALDRLEHALVRREAGEPVAYIRGFKEFHGIALAVDRRALIPRPETELLVDLALAEVVRRLTAAPRTPGSRPIAIADVGTGSGAIAIALAIGLRRRRMLDEVSILATDASADALDLAKENAVGHAVADAFRFAETDLLPPVVERPFDLVLANLPYVRTDAIDGLPVATSFEPRAALDGGPDGLAVIERLVVRLPAVLAADGAALLEIGGDQGEAIVAAVAASLPGWDCRVDPDLGGLPRVAVIRR